jgi:DNA-binding CsgD family transcriptional regulator
VDSRAVSARGDLLDLVEGAYDTESSPDEWLKRAADGVAARFEGTVHPFGYTLAKRPDGPPYMPSVYFPVADDARAALEAANSPMSPEAADLFFPKGTHVTLYREVLAALPPGTEFPTTEQQLKQTGADDVFGVTCVDATGFGLVVGAAIKAVPIGESTRDAYLRLGVHLAAGLRLRRALGGAALLDRAEAIFETDGRLAHAEGRATDGSMRSLLQEAVGRVDRARTNKVRKDEVTALELWQGLVEGRWSLVDRYDTDGRRYYVAIANPTAGMVDRALTDIERQVAAQVVAGEPNKVIAYTLGLAESTVASRLTTAMKKLGVSSRMELVRLGRSLGV